MRHFLRPLTFLASVVLAAACGKSGDGGPCTTCPAPAIALGVSTNSLSIAQGANGSLTATITRSGGFTGAVTITTEGAPAGVTATPSNVSTSGTVTTGTITVDVAASVAAGTYNLVARGSGAGVTSVTQPITLTVTAAPAISIALSASAQSVDQGATGAAVTVTITRTNFTGTVNLALDGAPAGVTAAFTPAGTGNTSTLTIQAGAAVPAALYNLTVHATGTGVTDATVPLALTVTVPASFTLSAAPVSIVQGGPGQSAITITRAGFSGPVTLSLEGAPPGVTAEFNPIPATGASATLDLSVGSGVTAQPYTLTVRGVAAGLTDRTTTFVLTVTPLVVSGSYSLTSNPSLLTVATASGGTAFTVSVNRTGGFTGPVTLAATGLPGNLTATFTPSVVTGNTAVVKVVPDQSSTVGSSQVTITGTTPGLTNKTAQIQIATSIPNVTFDYSACSFSVPAALWFQDGVSGPWVELLPLGGRFKMKLNQAKVGFAVSSPGFGGGGGSPPWVRLRSLAELQAFTVHDFCDDGNPGPNTVNISGTGLPTPFDQAIAEFGGAQHQVGGGLPNVTLIGVLPGTHDLIARSVNQNSVPGPTDRIIIRRGLNPGNGGTITPALNFDPTTGEGFAPITATMTVTGFVGGEVLNGTGTGYYTVGTGPSCDAASLYGVSFFAPVSSFTAYGVPSIKQLSTDAHRIIVTASGTGTTRQVTEYFHSFGPRSIALASNLPAPVVTLVPGSTFRLQFAFTLPPDLSGSAVFASYVATGQSAFLDASAAWVGGSTVTLTMPDFSVSADFDPATLPVPGVSRSWNLGAQSPPVNPCGGVGRLVSASRSGFFP